jgi:thiamine-monophosphate kinase
MMGEHDSQPESAEDRLIARFFGPLATHPGALGLTDDAAALEPPPGHDLVLKTDAIVGNVHFLPDDPPDAIARKALRVNLSDLAAKGAWPLGFLLALAIPPEIEESWLQAFSDGLKVDCEEFNVPLFGGDTDRTNGPVTVAVFVLGAVPRGTMVRRSGARPGDAILVTGTIGDGALGLRLRQEPALAARWALTEADAGHLRARYRIPEPRLTLAEGIRTHASASMDVSDGLIGDLAKLCRVSGVSAEIEADRVPLSAGARAALRADAALIEPVLTGGDDFDSLCTIAPDRLASFLSAAKAVDVPVAQIGHVVGGTRPPVVRDRNGRVLAFTRSSFSHF